MFYVKRKNYAGRWLVRIIQATLIFGIIFYGLDLLGNMVEPQGDTVVIEQNLQDIRGEQLSYDEVDYFYFGLDHHQASEYYEAIADYSRSIELSGNVAASYLNRGVAYEQLGNNESRAIADFAEWASREGMTILTHDTIDHSFELTATMSANYRYDVPFELSGGDIVSLSVDSMNTDQVDPIIVLLDPLGNPVAASDDVVRADGSLVSMNSNINQYEAHRTGEYTLMVTHAGGGSFGNVVIDIDINR